MEQKSIFTIWKENAFWVIKKLAVVMAFVSIIYSSTIAVINSRALDSSNQKLLLEMEKSEKLKTEVKDLSAALEKERKKSEKTRFASSPASYPIVCGGPGTIARKFNNPCNVKAPANGGKWKGQLGVDKEKHVHFKSVFHGIRAAAITLRSYYTRHGIKTINGIIDRFCGGHPGYVKFLCEEMNLKPDQEFNVISRIPELVWLMSQYESSRRLPEDYVVTLDVIR